MKKAPSTPAALSLFLVLCTLLAPATWAQPTRPIYPVYEGNLSWSVTVGENTEKTTERGGILDT